VIIVRATPLLANSQNVISTPLFSEFWAIMMFDAAPRRVRFPASVLPAASAISQCGQIFANLSFRKFDNFQTGQVFANLSSRGTYFGIIHTAIEMKIFLAFPCYDLYSYLFEGALSYESETNVLASYRFAKRIPYKR